MDFHAIFVRAMFYFPKGESKMKVCLSFALSCLLVSGVFAQPGENLAPVKDGDKIAYKYVVYGEKGKELFAEKTIDLPAIVTFSGKDYTIKYQTGRVETYTGQHINISQVSRGKPYTFPSEEQFLWQPKDFSAGKKDPVTYLVQSTVPGCAIIKNTLPDVNVETGVRVIKVQGVEKQVPVQIVTYKGNWSGSCGRGNYDAMIVYSPDLNFIVEKREVSYLPSGFLSMGYARLIDSLN